MEWKIIKLKRTLEVSSICPPGYYSLNSLNKVHMNTPKNTVGGGQKWVYFCHFLGVCICQVKVKVGKI